MKTFFTPTIFIIIGIIVLMYLGNYIISIRAIPSLSEYLSTTTPSSITIKAPEGSINAEIVNTPALLMKGLSGRYSLPTDGGMLFIFSESDKHNFWMKDMNFSIDIVWIDSEKTVIGVDSNISPITYPNKYIPSLPVKYVLELNANSAKKFGIATGTQLLF